MSDEKANIFKVQYLHGRHGRICGGHKREGGNALPGEICRFAARLLWSRDQGTNRQKSAEAIVVAAHRGEGPNISIRTDAGSSMDAGDAGRKAGKPEPPRTGGDGIAEGTGSVRQTSAARTGDIGDETTGAPVRPVRRRLQRVREVEGGGGSGAGLAGAILGEGAAAFDQSRQERGGSPVAAEVSGLQRDQSHGAETESRRGVGEAFQGQDPRDASAGSRKKPFHRGEGTRPRSARLGRLLPVGAGEGNL